MNNNFVNGQVQYYVNNSNLEEAIRMIDEDTIDKLITALEGMYEPDLFDLVQQYNGDLHRMDELDDVFEYMTVTEVLEELQDINLMDEYFNADNICSGDDIFDVAGVKAERIARDILEEELVIDDDLYEICDILQEREMLIEAVTDLFKVYERAEELFRKAMAENPQEVVSLLWNMNM